MSYHAHVLAGCAPTPLAHYLKALAILRLVSEQKDSTCRGAWRDDMFVLVTTLSRDDLQGFFLEEYRPTAIVSPWNKGSGFFRDDDPGLAPIERSTAPRLQGLRGGIASGRRLSGPIAEVDAVARAIKARTKTSKKAFQTERQASLVRSSRAFMQIEQRLAHDAQDQRLDAADRATATRTLREAKALAAWPASPPDKKAAARLKESRAYKILLAEAERQFKELKASLVLGCGLTFRGSERAWLDAALVLKSDGEPDFPALLGTGGNDGNLDFTNNFLQRLGDLFDVYSSDACCRPATARWLAASLWGPSTWEIPAGAAVGQYLPCGAGGANSSTGPDGDSLVNPWDFVLMMEGTVAFASGATRRLAAGAVVQASAPFAFRSHAAGGVLSVADEYHKYGSSQQSLGRGEQWMPLWARYLSLPELKSLIAEGRAQIGRRVAGRPVDMARAISRLGVTRGIASFQRYGYLERNGQSNFAVPLGRIAVTARPRSRLVDELAAWLDRLHRSARDKRAPARLSQAERRLSDAVFAALTHDDAPALWQGVLRAAVGVEQLQAGGTGIDAGPIPILSVEWIAACDDGSAEFRLACALGSAVAGHSKDRRRPVDSIRHHWLPLKADGRRFDIKEKRLAHDVRVVAHGRDPEDDLIAVVERRAVEAAQKGGRHPRIVAADGPGAHVTDLAAWLAGELDEDKCVELGRAFMALDWARTTDLTFHSPVPAASDRPDDAWAALRLNALPWPIDKERDIPLDPAIVRRLAAGDMAEAIRQALRRLQAHGIRPAIRGAVGDATLARRWGAALAFPISFRTAQRFRHQVHPKEKETDHGR